MSFQTSIRWVFVIPLAFVSTTTAIAQISGNDSAIGKNILKSGDDISITVFGVPELSPARVPIESDGTAKLPLVGDVYVAGLSESEAAHRIDKAYQDANLVLQPQSVVNILSFALNGVSITGEVARPGNYPVTGPRTLLDIIALSGGLTQFADTMISIQRANGDIEKLVSLPPDNGVATLTNNVEVFPRDRVVVQRAGTVYVLGDVTKPGGYLMQRNGTLTALQAIAEASGTSRISGENRAVLVRRNGDSYITTPLPLRDMYKGKTKDVVLVSGDVIYVPASNVRNFVFNAPQILAAIGGAAIYSTNR